MQLKKIGNFVALTLMFSAFAVCRAQFSANVQGTVSDTTGAVLANGSLTLHNVNTGVDIAGKTNSSGFYRFSSVAPGNYTVTATAAGFGSASVAVLVTTAETRGVDITLPISKGATNVTVHSIATALNPDETRIQTTISSAEITKLPLPNRDVQMLIALTPGVVGFQNDSANTGYGSSIFSPTFKPPYSANGRGTNSNLYLIDDLPVMDANGQGTALMMPNAEMISEVSLQTQTYSVENGTAASLQTAFTTKSGVNDFHGSADYSYASSNLGSAADPISHLVSPGHQNLWLGSLGGPIRKNHTFFFGSFEKMNRVGGQAAITNPYFTPQFAAWALQEFPNSGAAQALVFAPPTRDIEGTVHNASDYPKLNCGTNQVVTNPDGTTIPYNLPCDMPVNVSGAFFNQTQPFTGNQWNVRLDQNFRNGQDRIYVMYERIDQKLGVLAERPALDGTTPSQNKYFSVNYVHLFNPRLLNEAHFGNLRAINGLRMSNPEVAGSIPYLPILSGNDGTGFTFPFGSTPFESQINKTHTYAFRDALTYTKGNHTIRGGYQYYRGDAFQDSSSIYSRPFVPYYGTGAIPWISNTAQAGYSLYTIGGNGQYNPQLYGASSTFQGVFIEDNWKATNRLTLTYGMRYDNFGNPVPYGSTAQPFVPMFPGSGSTFQERAINTSTHITKKAFTSSQNLNFMPRVGFAYTPTNNKFTLIHGGIGLYENALTPFQVAGNLPTQPPNRISLYTYGIVPYGTFNTTAPPYGRVYSFPAYGITPWGNVYSNATQTAVYGANLNGFVSDVKPEKVLNYSFGIEQQLGANIVFGISYVGSHGYDLIYGSAGGNTGGNADYNLMTQPDGPITGASVTRPTPTYGPGLNWGSVNYGRNGLSSNFNQMVVTLQQNYKNLSYQANYNWSRALQYAPISGGYSIWNSINDPKSFYGPSATDVPNSFSFAGAYEVPRLFQNSLANQAAAGWRISAIVIAQSGTPFTVTDDTKDYLHNGSVQLDGTGGGTPGFPTYLGTKRRGFSRSQARTGVFTRSQFVDPAGTGIMPVQSTQGANTFRNLGYFTVNASLAKGFSLHLPYVGESGRFVLRGEALNLLNHTNYGPFGGDVNNATTFGKATTANAARYVQVGGRFEF